MHQAFESFEVLKGLKDKPESILVHSNKLLIGDNHGALSIYKLNGDNDAAAGETSISSTLLETKVDFSKSKRPIELLGIIKESNTLVSLSDSIVSLHDLSTLSPSSQLTPSSNSSGALPQTKSALTFSTDTSVQRRLLPPKPPSRFIHRDSTSNFNQLNDSAGSSSSSSTLGRNAGSNLAYRPSGTLPRGRNPLNASGSDPAWRQSLRGMEDLVREKEERELRVREGLQNVSRDGIEVGDGEEGIMTLVTVLAVGCRRKVILFRWVDGEFWDTKEVALPHSPRSLAFPTPTSLLLGYSSTDYSILTIPLASSSSVFSNRAQSSSSSQSPNLLGTGVLIPLNSSSGPRVDMNLDNWRVKELNLPQNEDASEQAKNQQNPTTSQSNPGGVGGGLGAAFGGLTGYIGLGPKTNKNSKSIVSIETGETLFTKEGQTSSFFLDEFGKPSRKEGIEWNGSVPEDLSFAKPYLVAILPAGTPYNSRDPAEEPNSSGNVLTRSKSLHPSAEKSTSIPSSSSFASWGNPLASSSNDHQVTDLRSLIQIRSSTTLVPVQTFPFPPKETPDGEANQNSSTTAYQLHHLTSSPGSKPPFFLISTPLDRNLLEKNGSSVWKFEMKSWNSQIEELISKKEWTEALRLIEGIDERMLGLGIGKKIEKTKELRLLHSLELFKMERFEEAIDIFTELDLHPAKVLALFPKEISGDLSRDRDDWEEVVGGRKRNPKVEKVQVEDRRADAQAIIDEPIAIKEDGEASNESSSIPNENRESNATSSIPIPASKSSPSSTPIPSPSSSSQVQDQSPAQPRPRERSRFTSLLSGGLRPSSMIFGDHVQVKDKEADAGSIRSIKSNNKSGISGIKPKVGDSSDPTSSEATNRKALDALGRFLADRRRIFMPLLESLDQDLETALKMEQTPPEKEPDLAKGETEYLLSVPSVPLNEMDLKDLKEVAVVVDTALFKTFLKTKPGLIGSLCRVRNWCKVEEVEGVLEERKKFSELISLYSSKHLHGKALALLRKFADEEDAPEEKLDPTIRYLQNLDERFIDVILETAHWVLREDPKKGMEIFTADTGRVADFPRLSIVYDLEKFDSDLCVEYLEHIISALGEGEPELHEKLIFGYLKQIANIQVQLQQGLDISNGKKDSDVKSKEENRMKILKKMLGFLESSQQYDAEKILGHMPSGSPSTSKTSKSQSKSRSQKSSSKPGLREEELDLNEESTLLFQARATLLGRMGQHEGALGIYVHRLKDHSRAEDYCKRVWNENLRRERDEMISSNGNFSSNDGFRAEMNRNSSSGSSVRNENVRKEIDPRKEDRNVFLTLLRIYLRPNSITANTFHKSKSNPSEDSNPSESQNLQLDPALSLISRHSARLDTNSVLSLLPPLVKLKDIQPFTRRALQQSTANRNECRILREISQSRELQVEERRIARLRKRIRVEENRTCPRCQKRLGNSVIAVTSTGAVLHYFCSLNNTSSSNQIVSSPGNRI